MTTITTLQAELYALSQQHAAHLAQAQQHQQAAANIERECIGRQAVIAHLEAEAAKEKSE